MLLLLAKKCLLSMKACLLADVFDNTFQASDINTAKKCKTCVCLKVTHKNETIIETVTRLLNYIYLWYGNNKQKIFNTAGETKTETW